ncbi:hypothetical protein AB1Y20_001385 [Prymnesium parvum]|uniref:CXXC-type zinc finger protein 1 n=1 Tax=Prymnesium parvum TaxID=97485 RepID=A0AB34KB56_PRYPA
MAPRKRTCLSTGRPEGERCTACANPRLKGKCTFAGDVPREMELPETQHQAVGPVRQWEVVDASDFEGPDDCDDEVAAGVPCSTSTSLHESDAKRERRAPQVFRPDEFWRRAIPAVASSTSTQELRASEIVAAREKEILNARKAGFQDGKLHSEGLVKEIRERLEQLASELTKSKEECRAAVRAASELRRKTEAEKRQKTLHFFFSD